MGIRITRLFHKVVYGGGLFHFEMAVDRRLPVRSSVGYGKRRVSGSVGVLESGSFVHANDRVCPCHGVFELFVIFHLGLNFAVIGEKRVDLSQPFAVKNSVTDLKGDGISDFIAHLSVSGKVFRQNDLRGAFRKLSCGKMHGHGFKISGRRISAEDIQIRLALVGTVYSCVAESLRIGDGRNLSGAADILIILVCGVINRTVPVSGFVDRISQHKVLHTGNKGR